MSVYVCVCVNACVSVCVCVEGREGIGEANSISESHCQCKVYVCMRVCVCRGGRDWRG